MPNKYYERPLVPQDVRERKGSFYTPRQWVELSQQYLADYFGKNWQEEYYIWDCAAGTGNLLVGLTNKYHIWASTLDQADVDIMQDRIANGTNLLESHVFQFDFLNDDFSKLPEDLQAVINDEYKRQKLIIYINPPYAGATSSKSIIYKESKHKCGVANTNQTYLKYKKYAGKGINELSVQFLLRSYFEIPNAYICNFSKITLLQGTNLQPFRNNFQAKLEKLFLVPSYTFDNVTGKFPIGFFIWNTKKKIIFKKIIATVYNQDGSLLCKKNMICPNKIIMKWLQRYYDHIGQRIAYLVRGASDFQNNRTVFITDSPSQSVLDNHICHNITMNNLSEMCIYFTIRHIIQHTWINDRDQFLFPNKLWEQDHFFQTDCLTFALFNNHVKSKNGQNDWIPFTEQEVHAQSNFKSHFMVDYMTGKLAQQVHTNPEICKIQTTSLPQKPLQFSQEAQNVFASARALYQYYHKQDHLNVNASLYEIREYFQQRNVKGKLNVVSNDCVYNDLNNKLKTTLKTLATKIAPQVYDYGFLKR